MVPTTRRIVRAIWLLGLVVVLTNVLWPRAKAWIRKRRPAPIVTGPVQTEAYPEPRRDLPPPQSLPPPIDEICPVGMVAIDGVYCPSVAHDCIRHFGEKKKCVEYAPTSRCFGELTKKRFCIDRYEYPNRRGAKPDLAMTWEEAKATCEASGKRLCTDSEWTLACEGSGRLPYPYGYRRDASACNIDRPYRFPNDAAWASPRGREREIARLDQREPSGSRLACVSPYGVFDMTGNVDEWVRNERGRRTKPPYTSGLKGGYWGPVRNRCRPMTTDHNQWHSGYQIGFRCCSEATRTSQAKCDPAAGISAGPQCSLASAPAQP